MQPTPAQLYDYDPLQEPLQVQPFSILDTRATYWQRRRGQWHALGIRPEVKGRGEGLLMANQDGLLRYEVACGKCGHKPRKAPPEPAQNQGLFDLPEPVAVEYPRAGEACRHPSGCPGTYTTVDRNVKQDGSKGAIAGGTSIFDPVLCEAVYRWYCPKHGRILDPFAGGAVRGIVAAKLQRLYMGVELRPEQVADNRRQAEVLAPPGTVYAPHWVVGDCTQVLAPTPPPYTNASPQANAPYDLVFSCPPYYDAEVYSDDPRDLSNLGDYAAFTELHERAIDYACRLLAPDRYAVWVIGEARSQATGEEYGLVADTVAAFRKAGLVKHGEMIVANAIGTLPLRMGKQWAASRAPGRHHQHVLVFRKGDRKAAAAAMEPLQLFDDTTTT